MQPETKLRKGLYNSGTGVDWSANIITDDTAGYYLIKNTSGELLVPPILKGSIINIKTEASAAEVTQYVTIGDVAQVIVANTRYGVTIEFPKDRYNGNTHERRIFSTMSAVTLSGTATTDRSNVYTALAAKINAYVPQYTKAKIGFTFTAVSTGAQTLTVGMKLYHKGGTYVGLVTNAQTTGADGVAVTIAMVDFSGTRPSGTTDVFCLTSNAGTDLNDGTSVYVSGQSLVLYDEGGYFSLKEKIGRGGAPIIFNSTTFTLRAVLVQAAVLSHGIGTDMLTQTPEYNMYRDGVDRGDIQRQFTSLPVAGKTYKRYIFLCKAPVIPNAIDGSGSSIPIEHNLYVEEAVHSTVNSTLVGLT